MEKSPAEQILDELKAQANPANVAGMKRYGISSEGTLGIPIPVLRKIARREGKNQALAEELWESGIHEARILAAFLAEPDQTSPDLMDRWTAQFDSWDICDQVCSNLFDRTPYAIQKALDWSQREETFVRRAGFVMMAALAVYDKKMTDEQFEAFLPLIVQASTDERNFVKKAVNWALRQIGKRNLRLNQSALETAHQISQLDSRSARWIAADAIKELTGEKVQQKFS